MIVAVLSGKGGAGKTFVSVNLAAAAKSACYIDCDVEEPNGRLFFSPDDVQEEEVFTTLPVFDGEKCTGCRKCVDFCRFNALIYAKDKPMVFPEVCHACGGCQYVCPAGAVKEVKKRVGVLETGHKNSVEVLTGVLDVGQVSGVPVIHKAIDRGLALKKAVTVIDCPPGSACTVMESLERADVCLLVVEPTAFGFHNFKMVYELVKLFDKPAGVVINKETEPYAPLEDFLKKNHIPVYLRVPYTKTFAENVSAGQILYENVEEAKVMFDDLLRKTGGAGL